MTARDDGLCAKVWVLGVFGCQKTLFIAVVVCIGDHQPKLLHITLAHSGRPAAAKDELAEEYPGCMIPASFSQDAPADYTGVVEYVMGQPRQGRSQDQRPGRRQPSQRQT